MRSAQKPISTDAPIARQTIMIQSAQLISNAIANGALASCRQTHYLRTNEAIYQKVA